MRAITLREHGGPEQLLLEELPIPEPGVAEVLVKVEAVSINHLDLWVRRGLPGLGLTYPHILGSDIAGTVARLGPGVTGLAEGTPVLVQPGLSCRRCRECLAGRDNRCRHYRLLGEHVSGGCVEYLVVPAENLLVRPAGLGAIEAAALPVTFMTAWQMLVGRARVEPGETVLVLGAGSGVGVAALAIARLLGARVIAASTSDEKLERAAGLGADATLRTDREDFVAEVKRLTGKRGADVIIEHVGQATWQQSILACAGGGRIVTCGATSGWEAVTDLRHLFYRQLSILGSTMGTRGDLAAIVEHVAAGRLSPVIDTVLPLAEARAAHERLEGRAQFGKIVLAVG
ncbi:MAG: alcohol dehydrogenase [Myxococcales bacterium]|nr:alcohol dehydrogenase [Myxococcales bacterium]